MGMYTECRGWIKLKDIDLTAMDISLKLKKTENISIRSSQCLSSTTYNIGFNWSPYIFIGGAIKNYDDDWNKYILFLFNNFEIEDYSIQTRYCEDESWREFALHEVQLNVKEVSE